MVLVLAGAATLTILAFLAFQDVPPLLHYVWLLVVGAGLVLCSSPQRLHDSCLTGTLLR